MAKSESRSWIRENPVAGGQPLNSHEFSYGVMRLLLGCVLAVGGAMVWSVIIHMPVAWVAERTVRESRDIVYRESGEPVIQHNRDVGYTTFTREYRTFDDELVTISDEELRKMWHPTWRIASFPKMPMFGGGGRHGGWPRRLVDLPTPLPWSVRLEECSIHRRDRHPVHWFFVWPDRPGGMAWLTSYDATTKSPRGTLGPSGFQAGRSSDENGFPIWDRNGRDIGRTISDPPNYDFPRTPNGLFALSEGRDADVGMLYLTPARDAISVINLTQQKVEVARTIGDVPLRGFAAKPLDRNVAGDPGMEFLQHVLMPRLILRWPDHLEFVTPEMKTLATVTLPEELREVSFQLSELKAGGFVAEVASARNRQGVRNESQLIWFDDNGTVTQRRTVVTRQLEWTLANQWWLWSEDLVPTPLALMPWRVPALWMNPEIGTIAHLFTDDGQPIGDTSEPLTWSIRTTAFATVARRFPWTFGVCFLSGVPFAIACWWRQRRFGASRFERLAWPLLVYLFGLVGWIAFVAHREWPSRRVGM